MLCFLFVIAQSQNYTVTVLAKPLPQGFNIPVRTGDQISIRATGSWCWGGGNDCSTAAGTYGRPLKSELPVDCSDARFGELIGRISSKNSYFRIGTSMNIIAKSSGYLILGQNDRIFYRSDNTGSINVNITIIESANITSPNLILALPIVVFLLVLLIIAIKAKKAQHSQSSSTLSSAETTIVFKQETSVYNDYYDNNPYTYTNQESVII